MIYQVRSIIAGLIVLMGLVHTGFAFPVQGHDINELWFISAGITLIFSGLLNIAAVVNCEQRWLSYVTISSNTIMLALFLYARQFLKELQVYTGIYLFLALLLLQAFQLKKRKPYQQYKHPVSTKDKIFSEPLSNTEVVPIFRMFDKAKAIEFYIDWLGFTIDWEHRFEENLPLYMQVSKSRHKATLVRTSRGCRTRRKAIHNLRWAPRIS